MKEADWDSQTEVSKDKDHIMEDDNSEKSQEMQTKEDFLQSPARITRLGGPEIDPMQYELAGASSPQWTDILDEKGDGVFYMMHLEKSIIHQKFFDNFDDDFDDEDLS